jgi:hypothetical protein
MARIWVVAVLVLAMLAGCSDREPASADLQFQVGGREPAVIVPGDRPVVASAIFREDPDQGVFDLDFVDGATTWEARDVELTYHGIHQGWDEWGRSIPVFVFRYMPMVLEIDEIEITATGVELSGQWRPHLVEYLFDAADGRFIGAVDLDAEVRNFIDPSQRHALTWSYTSTLFLFMQWKALGGVPGSFEAFGMTYAMERYDGEPPVAGNCDAYQLVRVEPPPKGNRTTLVCLEKSSQVPLWAYSGQADEGMLFQRQGQGFGLPPFEGAALSPHVFDTAPWDTVAVEPQKPVHVAPAARRGDWAYELQERTRALYLQPEFMVYNLRHDDVYLFDAMTGWPPHTPLSLLDLVNPPTVPLRAKQTSWLMLTPDEGMFWGFVDTYSRPGDGEDLHVAQAKAYEFEGPLGRTYPSLEELPDVPLVGDVTTTYASLAPPTPRIIQFSTLPEFDDIDWGAWALYWLGIGSCFEEVEDAPFAWFSAVTGQLMSAGHVHSYENGCSVGGGGMRAPDGTDVLVVPRPDASPVLVVDGHAIVDGRVLPVKPIPSTRPVVGLPSGLLG